MSEELNITIDGTTVRAKPGQMVLEAAMEAEIYIPYLCYYPGTKPFGACRMCVVTVDGRPGAPASCTTPVAPDMVVQTTSPEVVELRRGIMDLLLSEHPHGCLTCHRIELCGPADVCLRHVAVNDRCVTCPKNERCELKDTARWLEMDLETPLTYQNRGLPQNAADPFWEMDMNLCIVCGRCVRVCDEIRGDTALTFLNRAGKTLIGTSQGTSLLESGCEFCGSCIDACPTGALVERDYKWDKAQRTTKSVCPHCPVGCVLDLEVNRREKLIRSVPDRRSESNRGQTCVRGKFGLDFVNSKKRLQTPMVRRDGELQEASWTEALDLIADRFGGYAREGGYALLASPRCTNEDAFVAQKFARSVMKTNSVDFSSNTVPQLVTPIEEMLGHAAATNPTWDLELARCILVVSSNLTEEQNVVGVPIKRAVRAGAKLIVIDQRETELTRYADIWLRPKPGSDQSLIAGMLRTIMDESLGDHDFVAGSCTNVSDMTNSVAFFHLGQVSEETGIPEERIREAARLFATHGPAALLFGMETVATEDTEACVRAIVNLALATGNVGKPAAGVYPLFVGANTQGGRDAGCSPTHLPGYVPVSDEDRRRRFEKRAGYSVPKEAGIGAADIVAATGDGRIRALQVVSEGTDLSAMGMGSVADVLGDLEFLVVHASFLDELAAAADVVLPAVTFAESEGTYTNLERRIQMLSPALGPKGDQESLWHALVQIARRMGSDAFDYQGPSEIFDEMAGQVPTHAWISYERLEGGPIQWPCPNRDSRGTPRLCVQGDDSKPVARFSSMERASVKQHADSEFPLILARGRTLLQSDNSVEVVLKGPRNVVVRKEPVELHPQDAASLGLKDGDPVDVVGKDLKIRGVVHINGIHPGMVATTELFGVAAGAMEATRRTNPMMGAGRLSLVPVRLEPVSV